jgi:hypothetical protein
MSLVESVWADGESDDLLFECPTRTIDGETSAFDAGDGLEFGNLASERFSTKRDQTKHQSIVLDREPVAFEDQQLACGWSGTNQNISAAYDPQQQAEQSAVASDSSKYRDRSVLDLKSDDLGITTRSSSIRPVRC